jgi:hypothetical protein
MGLDAEKLHRLKEKSFDTLYSDHEAKWKEMVAKAKNYTMTYLDGGGDRVRPADVSAILQTAIRVDPHFEKHLQNKRLQQKYWAEWFADYAIENVYPPPDIQ